MREIVPSHELTCMFDNHGHKDCHQLSISTGNVSIHVSMANPTTILRHLLLLIGPITISVIFAFATSKVGPSSGENRTSTAQVDEYLLVSIK